MEASDHTLAPPYFAFKTLTNMLTQMEEHGPPNRIDRSFLSSMAGAAQSQFIHGLKSLRLIEEDGTVRPRLNELVAKPDDRPALIGQILRDRYPEAVELGKGNATTGELVEVFRGYGVQGDTARKAIAFYLQAAKFAGDVPLSPNFQTPKVSRNPSAPKRRPKGRNQQEEVQTTTNSNSDIPSGLHPALAGLLADLPKRGQTWTQQQHDDFKVAFDAILKIAAPISDPDVGDDDPFDDDDGDAE